jgi:hypothetical protein
VASNHVRVKIPVASVAGVLAADYADYTNHFDLEISQKIKKIHREIFALSGF